MAERDRSLENLGLIFSSRTMNKGFWKKKKVFLTGPTGFKRVLEWVRVYQRGEDIREVCRRQIRKYEGEE